MQKKVFLCVLLNSCGFLPATITKEVNTSLLLIGAVVFPATTHNFYDWQAVQQSYSFNANKYETGQRVIIPRNNKTFILGEIQKKQPYGGSKWEIIKL